MVIRVYNRQTRAIECEQVPMGGALSMLYGNPIFRRLIPTRLLSTVQGCLADLPLSRGQITPFCQRYGLKLDSAEIPAGGFRTLNEFFVRRLKPEFRVFPDASNSVGSPAEGRIRAWSRFKEAGPLLLKGEQMELSVLVGSAGLASRYQGALAIIRLAPVDYHRFHFFDDGVPAPALSLPGALHSVSPLAVSKAARIFQENRRDVTEFDSAHFGRVLFIEIGALMVGRIRQTFRPGQRVKRGDEKGYFSFGGSTLLMIFDRPWVTWDPDIEANTKLGIETRVSVGSQIGIYLSKPEDLPYD